MSLVGPCRFIFSPSVLQIENRIFLLILSVSGRCINKCTTMGICALGIKINLLNISMRHLLHSIEILIMSRNFNTTFPSARAVIILSTRIIKHTTIDSQVIIMESLIHGAICSTYPYTFFIFAENCATTTA